MGHFPTDGAWWVACLIGFILCVLSAELTTHQLEMMTYASALGNKKEKRKSRSVNNNKKVAEKVTKGKEKEMTVVPQKSIGEVIKINETGESSHELQSNESEKRVSDDGDVMHKL